MTKEQIDDILKETLKDVREAKLKDFFTLPKVDAPPTMMSICGRYILLPGGVLVLDTRF